MRSLTENMHFGHGRMGAMLVGRIAKVHAVIGSRHILRDDQHTILRNDAILASPFVRRFRIGVRRTGHTRRL